MTTLRVALACALLASGYRPTGGREVRAATAVPDGASAAGPPGSTDTRLPIVQGRLEPFRFPLGDDVAIAALSRHGWIGLSTNYETHIDRVLFERPGIGKPGVTRTVANVRTFLRPAPKDVYVNFTYEKVEGAWLARIDGARAVMMSGVDDVQWFADTPAGLRAVRTDTVDREVRWQLYAVGKKGFRPLGAEHRDEMNFGMVAPPGELLIAAGKAQTLPGAPTMDQVRAVTDLLDKGDGSAAARLGGPLIGYLLHLTTDGKLVRTEPFPDQRPEGIALTDDGWIVVLGGGTLAGALKNGTVFARRATAAGAQPGPWRLLASDIEMARPPTQRGGWVCFEEMPGDGFVVHCINPGRALHVVSPRFKTLVGLFDIDLRGQPRVVLRPPLDDGKGGNRTVAMPLP